MFLKLAVATALLLAVPVVPALATDVVPTPGALTTGDPLFPALGNGGYRPIHYDLQLRYVPRTRILRGTATIAATATQSLSSFGLDLERMTVSQVLVDGVPAAFRRAPQKLVVTPATAIEDGHAFAVAVTYSGVPGLGDGGSGRNGWYARDDVAVAFAEPDGARRWFPVDSSPSAKATYDVTTSVPLGLTVLGNGRLVSHTIDQAKRTTTWHWREEAPMISYAATIAVGRFGVRHSQIPGGPRVVTAVERTLPPRTRRNAWASFAALPRIVRFLSTHFGPYPFAVTGGIFGRFGVSLGIALETQTKPLYDTYLDDDLQAHEIAHQWFGDSVTLTHWTDMWLHEGFATYAEWLWILNARQQARLFYALWHDWDARSRALATPSARTLFGPTTYYRGGAALTGLQMLMGDEAFFPMLREWTTAHRYGNVTSEEFIALARLRGGPDAETFLRAWLYGRKRPDLPPRILKRLKARGTG